MINLTNLYFVYISVHSCVLLETRVHSCFFPLVVESEKGRSSFTPAVAKVGVANTLWLTAVCSRAELKAQPIESPRQLLLHHFDQSEREMGGTLQVAGFQRGERESVPRRRKRGKVKIDRGGREKKKKRSSVRRRVKWSDRWDFVCFDKIQLMRSFTGLWSRGARKVTGAAAAAAFTSKRVSAAATLLLF